MLEIEKRISSLKPTGSTLFHLRRIANKPLHPSNLNFDCAGVHFSHSGVLVPRYCSDWNNLELRKEVISQSHNSKKSCALGILLENKWLVLLVRR